MCELNVDARRLNEGDLRAIASDLLVLVRYHADRHTLPDVQPRRTLADVQTRFDSLRALRLALTDALERSYRSDPDWS